MPAAPLDLARDVDRLEITDRLGEPATLTLELIPSAEVAFKPASSGGLDVRQTLLIPVEGGAVGPLRRADGMSEWRITVVDRTQGEGAACRVIARPIWEDLDEPLAYRVLTTGPAAGHPVYDFAITGVTAADALAEILALKPTLDVAFVAGTVPAAYASRLVTIEASRATKLDLIAALLQQLVKESGAVCEWEATWDGAQAAYVIDIVEEAGWTAAERTAGAADPTLRPIEAPTAYYNRLHSQPDSLANRIRMRERVGADGLFSAIVATGGKFGEVSVGAAVWEVTARSRYQVGTEWRSKVTLKALGGSGGPVYKAGALTELWLGNALYAQEINPDGSVTEGHNAYDVVDSFEPDQVEVLDPNGAAELNVGQLVTFFTANPSGGAGVRPHALLLPDAVTNYGRVERAEHYDTVAPYRNELVVNDVSADLSEWGVSAPLGWSAAIHDAQVAGAITTLPTFAKVLRSGTEGHLVRYGTAAARVTCAAAGTGIETAAIPIRFEPARDIKDNAISFHIDVTVESGRVRAHIGTAWDDSEPSGERKAEAGPEERIVAFEVGGAPHEAIADLKLMLTAVEPNTVFVVDCAAVTRSTYPVRYAPEMGPEMLWQKAGHLLARKGGEPQRVFDGRAFDEHFFQRASAPMTVGAWARIRDSYDGATGVWQLERDARIETVTMTLGPRDTAAMRKEVELSEKRPDLARFIVESGRVRPASLPEGGGSAAIPAGGRASFESHARPPVGEGLGGASDLRLSRLPHVDHRSVDTVGRRIILNAQDHLPDADHVVAENTTELVAGRLKLPAGRSLVLEPRARLIELGYASPITTKGDLIAGDVNGEDERHPVGIDDDVLTADSTAPLGIVWKPSGVAAAMQAAGRVGQIIIPSGSASKTITPGYSFNPTSIQISPFGQAEADWWIDETTTTTTVIGVKIAATATRDNVFNLLVSAESLPPIIDLVAEAGDAQVTLTWSAVAEADLYTVYWDIDSGDPYANQVDVQLSQLTDNLDGTVSYTVTGLTNGTTYYFVVTAKGVLESPYSNEAVAIPKAIITHIYDTFTDADGTLLTAHTPDVDAVGTGWSFASSEPKIMGGKATTDSTGAGNINSGATDVVVEATLSGFGSTYRIIHARKEGGHQGINFMSSGTTLSIRWGTTTLASVSWSPSLTAHVFKLVCSGGLVEGYIDGTLMLSATHTATAGQTYVGFVHQNAGEYIDEFKVTAP